MLAHEAVVPRANGEHERPCASHAEAAAEMHRVHTAAATDIEVDARDSRAFHDLPAVDLAENAPLREHSARVDVRL